MISKFLCLIHEDAIWALIFCGCKGDLYTQDVDVWVPKVSLTKRNFVKIEEPYIHDTNKH